MKAVAREACRADFADAVDEAHRLWREKGLRFAGAQHRETPRLVEIGCDFGEEFVAGQPDRNGDPKLLLDVGGKARQRLGRRHAVQPRGAAEVEERLVDRQRFDERRQRQHHLADLAAGFGVFFHVGPDHFRLRAQAQRLEHRHRRFHAEGAGDVAGGGDDAALAAADDDRLGGKRRVVALLDRGVEGVAVDMGDGERRQARHGAAIAASRRRCSACPAARHRQGSRGKSSCSRQTFRANRGPIGRRARCAPARYSAGSMPALSAKAIKQTLVGEHMLEHAGEKVWLGARLRGCPRR